MTTYDSGGNPGVGDGDRRQRETPEETKARLTKLADAVIPAILAAEKSGNDLAVLGLQGSPTVEQIKSAYRQRMSFFKGVDGQVSQNIPNADRARQAVNTAKDRLIKKTKEPGYGHQAGNQNAGSGVGNNTSGGGAASQGFTDADSTRTNTTPDDFFGNFCSTFSSAFEQDEQSAITSMRNELLEAESVDDFVSKAQELLQLIANKEQRNSDIQRFYDEVNNAHTLFLKISTNLTLFRKDSLQRVKAVFHGNNRYLGEIVEAFYSLYSSNELRQQYYVLAKRLLKNVLPEKDYQKIENMVDELTLADVLKN